MACASAEESNLERATSLFYELSGGSSESDAEAKAKLASPIWEDGSKLAALKEHLSQCENCDEEDEPEEEEEETLAYDVWVAYGHNSAGHRFTFFLQRNILEDVAQLLDRNASDEQRVRAKGYVLRMWLHALSIQDVLLKVLAPGQLQPILDYVCKSLWLYFSEARSPALCGLRLQPFYTAGNNCGYSTP